MHTEPKKMRVVVCGTTFGQVYLAALRNPRSAFELAGIVAQGSPRSRKAAERHGVPLYRDVRSVSDDVDIACVVVRSAAFGGEGTELAKAFMNRGVHVIQEHPVHHDEFADCLRLARERQVLYRLNAFYPQLPGVCTFVQAARQLLTRQPALFVDAACAIQVAYPLFEILARALGTLRPWALEEAAPLRDELRELCAHPPVFRTFQGVLGGVPLTLRVQNQLDPAAPDHHLHLLHQIAIGVEGGALSLATTNGPVLFSPRFHVPTATMTDFDFEGALPAHFAHSTCEPVSEPRASSLTHVLAQEWPDAVERALCELRQAIVTREDPRLHGQTALLACRIWQDLTQRLGFPELHRGKEPAVLCAGDVCKPAFHAGGSEESAS